MQTLLAQPAAASVLTVLFTAGCLTHQDVAIRNDQKKEGIENMCDEAVTTLDKSDDCT